MNSNAHMHDQSNPQQTEEVGLQHGDKWWLSDDEEEEDIDDEMEQDEQGEENMHASDDPLYDPNVDDEDEKLLHEGREGRVTDAILSCPGCFTTLTVDCQAHESICNRYRAIFVMNCEVDVTRKKVPLDRGRGRGGGKGKGGEESSKKHKTEASDVKDGREGNESVFHPVTCSVCGEEVGVMEAAEEIYHFIDCLASNA